MVWDACALSVPGALSSAIFPARTPRSVGETPDGVTTVAPTIARSSTAPAPWNQPAQERDFSEQLPHGSRPRGEKASGNQASFSQGWSKSNFSIPDAFIALLVSRVMALADAPGARDLPNASAGTMPHRGGGRFAGFRE